MWSKRAREYDRIRDAPEKRFRHNVGELFFDNSASGQRIESLLEDAHLAGAKHIGDLVPHVRKRLPKKSQKHAHRDLSRRFLKRNDWPPVLCKHHCVESKGSGS